MWANTRLTTYLLALLLSILSMAGVVDFDIQTGNFSGNIQDIAAALATGLATVAVFLGWKGKK